MNRHVRRIAEQIMRWDLYNYEEDRYASTDEDYEDAARNDGWTWMGSEDFDIREAHEWDPWRNLGQAMLLFFQFAQPFGECVIRFEGTTPDANWVVLINDRIKAGNVLSETICLTAIDTLPLSTDAERHGRG